MAFVYLTFIKGYACIKLMLIPFFGVIAHLIEKHYIILFSYPFLSSLVRQNMHGGVLIMSLKHNES